MGNPRLDRAYEKGRQFEEALDKLYNYESQLTREDRVYIATQQQVVSEIADKLDWLSSKYSTD